MGLTLPGVTTPNLSSFSPYKGISIYGLTHSKSVSMAEFRQCVTDLYGVRLVQEMEQYYPSAISHLDQEEIHQRLISLAALVKKDDVRALFSAIKKGDTTSFTCQQFLGHIDRSKLQNITHFNALTSEHLDILMSLFRYLPNQNKDLQAIGSYLYPLAKFPQIPKGPLPFQDHLTKIRAFERVDHFKQDQRHGKYTTLKRTLAASEHLSKEIAYGLPLDIEREIKQLGLKGNINPQERKQMIQDLIQREIEGALFPTLDQHGRKVYYEVKSSTYENGLVAFFCAPLTKGQWYAGKKTNVPLLALFRGTWCMDSLKRDLREGLEAGRKSFFGLTIDMIEAFQKSIPDEAKRVAVSVMGHSLGGVDAMRFAALLAKIRAERIYNIKQGELQNNKTDKVRSIKVFTWNAPGLLKKTCHEYNEHRAYINAYNQGVQKKDALPLSIRHTHVKAAEDAFQNFGKALLGWIPPSKGMKNRAIKNPNTKIVKFYLKKFYKVIGTTWVTHRAPYLSVDARVNRMRVKKECINQWLGPRSILRWVKMIASAVFRRMLRIPKYGCQIVKKLFVREDIKNIHAFFTARAIRNPSQTVPGLV